MPILIDSATTSQVASGRIIRIPGLPDFNAGDPAFKITGFEGWFDGQTPVPVLVADGGGAGAVAVGEWEPAEAFYTLTGRILTNPASKAMFRKLLLAAFPAGREVALQVLGNGLDSDQQLFVRCYDRPTFPPGEAPLFFTFPLVAPDPYKYALEPLTGDMGVFTGQSWFREYDPATFARSYALASGSWVRSYEQAVPTGPYPTSLTLTSDGDATSRRLVAVVHGPLPAGDWWLLNEATGERLWVEVAVIEGQELVLDMRHRTARLNGANVDHLVYGDWLSLASGANTYRLVSGTSSGAYAHIEALEASQ